MTSVHQWSLKSLSKQISGEPAKEGYTNNETKDTSAREERVDIRVGTPKQNMIHLFQTKNYKPSIRQHKKLIRELCERPVEMYAEMRSRLIEKGETVCFEREFSGVVGYLTRYLFQTFLKDKITPDKDYEIIGFAQCTHFIKTCAAFQKAGIPFMPFIVKDVEELQSKVKEQCGTLIKKGEAGHTSPQILKKSKKTVVCLGGHSDVVSYKCAEWFSEQTVLRDQLIPALVGIQIQTRYMYPYRATLYVIQRMLSIIDQYHRTQTDAELPPYYHNFRYEYYMTLLTDVERNDIVLMPTCAYVGSTILIKLRCIPVHVLGVVTEPTYADQYINSPLDFWAHDVNHARRTMLETERYYDTFVKHRTYFKKRNYWANATPMDFYKEMAAFTHDTLYSYILTRKKDWEKNGMVALKKIIIFEITHEKAWPITPDSILRNIVMGYDRFPVESLEVDKDSIMTRDFAFDDPTTLSNTIHKLRGGFYDDPNQPIDAIVPIHFRTSMWMAKAAAELFEEIASKYAPKIQRPSFKLLLALTTDAHDTEEFRDSDIIQIEDVGEQPYPDEEYTRPRPEDFIPGRI
jgi:hypothetical protein